MSKDLPEEWMLARTMREKGWRWCPRVFQMIESALWKAQSRVRLRTKGDLLQLKIEVRGLKKRMLRLGVDIMDQVMWV